MHIAIAGNIGSGKTTLTKMLAARYGWTPKFESVDFNPYLSDFYEDMSRWSFNLQIYFLNKRFKDVVDITKNKEVIIQDRTIYEDARIFAPNLHDMGLMSSRDFETYSDLFDLMMSLVKMPDLLIYLKSSIPNLVSQIQKRGREYEKTRPTIIDFVEKYTHEFASHVFLREKPADRWTETTFEQTRLEAYRVAAGLMALGINKGDKVSLLSEGRNMWVIGELGILYSGGVNVPLSIKLEEGSDLVFRINHSDSRFVMVSGTQLPKVRRILKDIPAVEKIIVLDDLPEYQLHLGNYR